MTGTTQHRTRRNTGSRASRPHVVVIGGGISGLSAALSLQEAGCAVTLLEAGERLGGKILTDWADGLVIDAGPDSILSYKPAGTELIRRLGLTDEITNTRPDGGGTFILHKGRLHPLPEGMTGLVPADPRKMLETDLISWPGKLRMALDYFLPAGRDGNDESVGAFVRRRLGSEFYENLAEPLLSGIYAGDADELSLLATFPRLRESEARHGGMIRSALAARRATPDRPSPSYSPFISLSDGLGALIDGLHEALSETDIRTTSLVSAIHAIGNRYHLEIDGGTSIDADGVVLAVPAWNASVMLCPLSLQLTTTLRSIPYASTATISLAFNARDLSHQAVGRGFVIPRTEGRQLTAVTWSSNKFPGRAPAGTALLRGFVGRAGDDSTLHLSDNEIIDVVRRELSEILGIRATPRAARVYRWDRALPQYTVGHLERIAQIDRELTRFPGLRLAGAAYRGVGIPDCIQDGRNQAQILAHQIGVAAGN